MSTDIDAKTKKEEAEKKRKEAEERINKDFAIIRNQIIDQLNRDEVVAESAYDDYLKILKDKNRIQFRIKPADFIDDNIAKVAIKKMFKLKMLSNDKDANNTKIPDFKGYSGYDNAVSAIEASRIDDKNVIVIKAGTGTGKSTILASVLLTEYKEYSAKKTLILSPRITNVEGNSGFVSTFFGVKKNTLVGYKHKQDDQSRHRCQKVTFITQESFLSTLLEKIKGPDAEVAEYLDNYSLIILDEAHENTIVNELLFYIFKQIRNLFYGKITFVILSATIVPLEFIKYFYNITDDSIAKQFAINNKLVVDIEGVNGIRKKYYLKKNCGNLYNTIVNQIDAILTGKNVDHLFTLPENHDSTAPNDSTSDARNNRDIIVFVPGQSFFKEIIERLEKLDYFDPVKYKIVKVYRDQPIESEKDVVANYETDDITKLWDRRIYLATTKAETGVTFPNMKYVIDTGLRNSVFHDSRLMVDSKLVTAISINNVLQREGRVARNPGDLGIVYCMYTEEFYNSLSGTDIPALLTENFEGYFFQMVGLCKKYNPEGTLYTMDFRSQSRDYRPFMNYYSLANYYGLIGNTIAERFLRHRTSIQTLSMICNGVTNGCLREILLFLAASEFPFYPEMKRVYNESANSYEFLGTIMPKIYFFSELEQCEYYPNMPNTIIDPHIKKLIAAGARANAKAYDTSENKLLYKAAVNYHVIKKYTIVKPRKTIDDLRHPANADHQFTKNIIEKFLENYKDLIKDENPAEITSAQSWKTVYKTIKASLALNRATAYYAKHPIKSQFDNINLSKNLFILPNNTLAMINPEDLKNMNHASHTLFLDELFYTKTIIAADGSQQFVDIL